LIEEGRGSRVRGRGGEKKKTFRGKKTAEHITFIVD
jgi:ribosomal protein S6E (S10)